MQPFTVSFFGHRMIDNALEIENRLEQLIRTLLHEHEYIEFLVGRDGEFDQLVSSTIRCCKREYRNDNCAHIWAELIHHFLGDDFSFIEFAVPHQNLATGKTFGF